MGRGGGVRVSSGRSVAVDGESSDERGKDAREGAACAEGDELMTCAFMSSQYDEHAKHSRLIALTVTWGGGGISK